MNDVPPPSTPPAHTSHSGLLSDEVVKRITAEEMFRFEVQKKLRDKDEGAPKSKYMKFVNSPFGLFLLSAIFISGLSGVFQLWVEQLKLIDTKHEAQKRIMSEYKWRFNDQDKLVADAGKATEIDNKGADSILIYRVAYGANEYQTSLPEFKGESWGGLITRLDDFANSEHADKAVSATDVLMGGPYIGQDTLNRGYFGPSILEDNAKILHLYYDSTRKSVYDTSIWRAFR
jgi:hypothetical protein